jgi:hypothetical protein
MQGSKPWARKVRHGLLCHSIVSETEEVGDDSLGNEGARQGQIHTLLLPVSRDENSFERLQS